jgi:hypothetical protein
VTFEYGARLFRGAEGTPMCVYSLTNVKLSGIVLEGGFSVDGVKGARVLPRLDSVGEAGNPWADRYIARDVLSEGVGDDPCRVLSDIVPVERAKA